MTAVDVHQHLWPTAFVDALRARRAAPCLDGDTLVLHEGDYRWDVRANDPEQRIRLLDDDGVDLAVLSLQPTLGVDRLAQAEQDELRDIWETGILEVVAASGGRFAALADGRDREGFVGATVPATAIRDVDALEPLLADLARSGRFLFVHPSMGVTPDGAPPWWPALIDYTSQMQAAYLTWLAYGQSTWPNVNVVFAILAGGGPFQLERLATRGVAVRSGLHENLFFDTATYGRRAIELCIETFGVHQIVYGSDAPVVDTGPTRRALHGFGESVVQLLLTDNPTRLLP